MRTMTVMVRVLPEDVDRALEVLAAAGFEPRLDREKSLSSDGKPTIVTAPTLFLVDEITTEMQLEHIAAVGAPLNEAGIPFDRGGYGLSTASPYQSQFTVRRGADDGRDLTFHAETWDQFDAQFRDHYGRPRGPEDEIDVEGFASNDPH